MNIALKTNKEITMGCEIMFFPEIFSFSLLKFLSLFICTDPCVLFPKGDVAINDTYSVTDVVINREIMPVKIKQNYLSCILCFIQFDKHKKSSCTPPPPKHDDFTVVYTNVKFYSLNYI